MESPACVDVTSFLDFLLSEGSEPSEEVRASCSEVVQSFHDTGVLIIKDPRVNEEDNWTFIDMMEQYYSRASQLLYNGEKVAEVHPELHFQVGATPEMQEKARDHCGRMAMYTEEDKPISPCPPQHDAKWRYFWRIGDFSNNLSNYEFQNVSPPGFPQWEEVMDRWGSLLLNSLNTVVRMMEVGMGIEANKMADMMRDAPNLLAPTGGDLQKYSKNSIFAGFHYDLNFITIHGKSRYPGLSVWLRNNRKINVKVPDGCLLLQAGKMLENLSGGYFMAGFHEVVYNDKTEEAVAKAREEGRPLWRVSSTLFGHLRGDVSVKPMDEFRERWDLPVEEVYAKYPQDMTAGDVVREELKMIGLWTEEETRN